MHFVVRDRLIAHIERLTERSHTYSTAQKNHFIVIATGILLGGIALILFVTEFVNLNYPVPEEWRARMRSSCNYGGVIG